MIDADDVSIGWLDINSEGIALITRDGFSERVQPPPIDPSVLDGLPNVSITISGWRDTPSDPV